MLKQRSHHRPRRLPPELLDLEVRLANLSAEDIESVRQMQPVSYAIITTRCMGCGRLIHPGNTAYILHLVDGDHALVCYECGEGLAFYLGITTPETTPWSRPYGLSALQDAPGPPSRQRETAETPPKHRRIPARDSTTAQIIAEPCGAERSTRPRPLDPF